MAASSEYLTGTPARQHYGLVWVVWFKWSAGSGESEWPTFARQTVAEYTLD